MSEETIARLMNVVFFGDSSHPGLVTRVEKLESTVEKIEAALSKIMWLLVTTVLIALLNLVIKR